MAPHANDRAGAIVADLLSLLGPRPGRLEYATRIALICALTVLVVQIYQTPSPALTAYVVFFLNRPDRAQSLVLSVVLLVLFSLLVGLTLVVAMAVIDTPLWRVVAMAVISFCFLFLTSASKLRPIGAILALVVGYSLDLLGTVYGGEFATRSLLYAWLFVGIPAGVSVAVNLLLAPAPRKLAERAIAERLRLAAAMLRGPDERIRRAFTECLREGMGEIQSGLKLAGAEKTSAAREIAALRQAADSTAAIVSLVDAADRFPEDQLPAPLRERLAQTLEEIASILVDGRYPVEIALDDPTSTALAALPARIWADLKEVLVRFAEPPADGQRRAGSPQSRRADDPPAGFLLPDAFTNPEHVHYALKTTAAAMSCYVLYSLLDWPGIHTCFITCYIVSLGTAAETIEKLTLRLLGCLIGAGCGLAAIVFLIPSLTSIATLLVVVFLGALLSAWVAVGSPRISYAGFQIAFAFFLCVIQGPSPAFDLEIARDRVIGIIIGNLAVYLMFTRVLPVSVGRRVDTATTSLLRQLSTMMKMPTPADRRALAAETQAALGAIERDLDLLTYEPSSIRPSAAWLRSRRRAAIEIDALEGPLLLIPEQDPSLSSYVASRLEDLAAGLGVAERPAAPAGARDDAVADGNLRASAAGEDARPRLVEAIDAHLRNLHDALSLPHTE